MTSRKARRFRAIFARNFLKIHTFFVKYWYFSELSCDKKNLKWIFISYGIYETRCVFYIPSPKARGYKIHNSFHKYRMKWKFISDPIFIQSCSWNFYSIIVFDWNEHTWFLRLACMIVVPKICNIHNSASLVVVCKFWTLVRIPSSLP